MLRGPLNVKIIINPLDFYHLNPLNEELNPICHFLALLGAHHIFHISRIRVNFCFGTDTWAFKYVLTRDRRKMYEKLCLLQNQIHVTRLLTLILLTWRIW
jgi:hypothetical protein